LIGQDFTGSYCNLFVNRRLQIWHCPCIQQGMKTYPFKNISRVWLLLLVALVLTGCGGKSAVTETISSPQAAASTASSLGDSDSTSSPPPPPAPPPPPPPPSATGSFSLSWTAPTTRADGSPISLADIDGYRVYYGSSKGKYPNQVNITNGAATSRTVNNLMPGTYFLVMTTYDDAGRESSQSPEITKRAM
jgi:hypothetical protein